MRMKIVEDFVADLKADGVTVDDVSCKINITLSGKYLVALTIIGSKAISGVGAHEDLSTALTEAITKAKESYV